METTESTHNTKVSDSAYSNSCSNSQSQGSGSSSKSKLSNSSGSSGYGEKAQPKQDGPQPPSKRSNDQKKKKFKSTIQASTSTIAFDDSHQTCTGQVMKAEKTVEKNLEEQVNKHETTLECSSPESAGDDAPVISPTQIQIDHSEDVITKSEIPEVSMTSEPTQTSTRTEKEINDDGFCCVMSMHDGVVLYTTPTITQSLGFPRDMWLGRSFIDFVHPKHQSTFTSQIASGFALNKANNSVNKDSRHSLFLMLRRYRGLTSGFGVINRPVVYESFNLSMTFREAPSEDSSSALGSSFGKNVPKINSMMLLVMSATPVKSIYKTSEEVFTIQREIPKFNTRHTSSGTLSHVDGTANVLGFLPQDIVGRKIMEFYHPEDMSLLKEEYETIMAKGLKPGSSFWGKPYRFLVQNGNYITVVTEWSSFVNPFSHRLEFVIGHHRVMKGPLNPDVLASSTVENLNMFSDEVISKSKTIQEEIIKLINESTAKPSNTVKQQVSKRCQVLAGFMKTLMDEVQAKSSMKGDLALDLLPLEADLTFSERDSAMLGEISPHHDYCDSKSSSETPPSYNQLNYNENLQRFFDSRPVNNIKEAESSMMDQSEEDLEPRTQYSPMQCFGGSGGSESAGNLSSTSHIESITNTSTGTSKGGYIPPVITEVLLSAHNEEMEKMIIKRHKVSRNGKNGDKNRDKKGIEKALELHSQGIKRCGSYLWEDKANKTSKHHHTDIAQKSVALPFPNRANAQQMLPNANESLWPPFSVSLTTAQNTKAEVSTAPLTPSSIFPTVYYLPQSIITQDQRGQMHTVQCIPSVVYQPVIYPPQPSTFYHYQPAPTTFNDAMFKYDKAASAPVLQIPTPVGSGSLSFSTTFNRPLSQATSVKADMGSTSASVVNRALSMSSRRCGGVESPTPAEGIRVLQTVKNCTSDDESSCSSFYSSFFKSDEGKESSNDDMAWHLNSKPPVKRPNPSWLDKVSLTDELVYQYQVRGRTLNEVLIADLHALKNVKQPNMVNDQLSQLYMDLNLSRDLETHFALESSGSSGEEDKVMSVRQKRVQYNKLVLVYEENCPLPSD